MAKPKKPLDVEALRHNEASRKNIPTAEMQPLMRDEDLARKEIRYPRNRDLDPQLMWRGKDEQDWSDLVVHAPPIYVQEKVHPKVVIDDLMRQSKTRKDAGIPQTLDLFADFNGLHDPEATTEFYAHDQNWTNRMILGDSLQVMASLAEREGLRGQVQCIYFDPPYGIKFNSNFQWSTTSRDVKDGNKEHISREPEQVRAFRDTWRDGIHSYLTYLRDRLTVARDLLAETGSIFVQIGDENVHRVRAVMDEVFGEDNFISLITASKTSGSTQEYISNITDFVIWFGKNRSATKYRELHLEKVAGGQGGSAYQFVETESGERLRETQAVKCGIDISHAKRFRLSDMTSQSIGREKGEGAASWFEVNVLGRKIKPGTKVRWKTNEIGIDRLNKCGRLSPGKNTLNYIRYIEDYPAFSISNIWHDVGSSVGGDKIYVVQTTPKIVERCILMATDPGDLVLDPTCGSGTTAYVAEQWGRRWITIDTSRVALALARARVMGARYPYYLLADSPEGQRKEAEITRKPPSDAPSRGDIRHGFVYERVPHITLKSIANNAEIDVIWDRFQGTLEPLLKELNELLGTSWEEWEVPRTLKEVSEKTGKGKHTVGIDVGADSIAVAVVGDKAFEIHRQWWKARIARQKEIDASIAAKAEFEYLYDKPYPDNSRVRVAGPFTVESLSPHRVIPVDENDELMDVADAADGKRKAQPRPDSEAGFAEMVIENLRAAGVQQAHKEDRIAFTSVVGWPGGDFIAAEGKFMEGDTEKRAAIFIGPEFGTVSRPDLVAAAREAADSRFDVLVACSFNFDAHTSEFEKLGRIPVLKARMNPDLHMADDLKTTGAGNLFVVFGEPDIDIEEVGDNQLQVKINGIDVFKPQTGEIEYGGPDTIACWFIDTDYNEESFFVRHAYFLGASDPYKALKTTLKAEIDQEAWESLYSDTSRPFAKPSTGRIAVKVINHLGDEVMKVFGV